MKIRKNNQIFGFFTVIFIILTGFFVFNPTNVKAAPANNCECRNPNYPKFSPYNTYEKTERECIEACIGVLTEKNTTYSFEGSSPKPVDINDVAAKNPWEALWGIDACPWNKGKGLIVCPLLGVLRLDGKILNLSVSLFESVINPTNVLNTLGNDAILSAWKIIRDICNIAFILILIFSAFATIFQVDKYNYKKILLWLVIMALLVNFSFPITRFIIDINNSLMYSVLNITFPEDFTLTNAPPGETPLLPVESLAAIITSKDTDPEISQLLLSIIFIFILTLTVLALALILLIRIIALAIIIIFSPIGFVGTVIGKDGGWWNYLFKYALAGPIIAFVLFISTYLMGATSNLADLPTEEYGLDERLIVSMLSFLIPIVILWFGMAMSIKGIEGAGTILGKAHGFAKWTGKLPWRGAKVLSKKIDRDYIGVRGAIKAWKDRTAELEADKVGYQTARARDWLGSIFDRGKRDSNFYRDVNDANMVAKYKKEQDLFSTTDVDVVAGIEKLKGKKDKESGQRLQAFYHTLAGNKDLNEHEKIRFGSFDPVDAKEHIYETLKSSLGAKNAVDALHDISDLNQVNGVYSMCGMTHDITEAESYDENGKLKGMIGDAERIGQRRKSTKDEQIDAAFAKMKQIDYQKMMIGLHADTIVTEDKDGNGSGVHDFGLKALEFIEGKDAKFVTDRWRGDTGVKIRQGLMVNPEVAARFPLILAALTGGEDALKLKKAELAETAKKKTGSTSGPATEAKPKEEPKKAESVKEEEPLIKVVGKYSPLK